MELQKQVVSLELAKQLKSLGVKQDSLFYWSYTGGAMGHCIWYKDMVSDIDTESKDDYSAFTVAELYNFLYMHGIGDILLDGVKPKHLADYLGEKLCKAL